MTLTEKLGAVIGTRRAADLKTYREIIGRADKPKPNDPNQLADTVTALGLRPGDVAADIAAAAEVRETLARIPSDADLAEKRRAAEAVDNDRRHALRRARAARMTAVTQVVAAYRQERELERLIRDAPELREAVAAHDAAEAMRARVDEVRLASERVFAG